VQALHLPAATAPDAARLPAGGVLLQAETGLEQHAPWLADCPGLTLLGPDAERDRVHVVTGHSQAVRPVGDLTRAVLEAACSVDK